MPFQQYATKYDVGFGEKAESYNSSATPSPTSSRHSTPPFEHALSTKPLFLKPLPEPLANKDDKDTSNSHSKLLTVDNLRYFQRSMEEDQSSENGTSRSSSVDENLFEDLELEKALDQHQLELLLAKFNPVKDKEKHIIHMDMKMFRKAIVELFNPIIDDEVKHIKRSADIFFKKIYLSKVDWQSNGKVMWDDICTYLLMDIKEEIQNHQVKVIMEPRIVQYYSIKEPIIKLMRDGNSSRFVQVTRNGFVNILSSNLQIKKTHVVEGVSEGSPLKNMKTKVWVTDCISVSSMNKLFITTADRDLQVYDMSSQQFHQVYKLYDMPTAAMCLDYHFTKCHPYGKLQLFLGTDSGDIQVLTFLQPTKSLFELPLKKSNSSINVIYFDLPNHSSYVHHRCISHVHSDWVRRILYIPESDLLFSCSTNCHDSLIYQPLHQKGRKVYNFKVMKGVDCFDFSKDLNLIATGSVDHVVRFWDPYCTVKPMAILKLHECAIIDIVIYEPANQVFSYSKDGHICCWDTKEYTCLQKILIKFPAIGRAPFDPGRRALYLFESLSKLLLTGEHCVAELMISTTTSRKVLPQVAHDREIVAAHCHSEKEQVISVSVRGEIIRWNSTTGKKIFTIHEPKIAGDVSAMTIDDAGEYLVTGSRNGTGAVWNLATAMCEKQLEAYSDEEITCLLMIPGKKHVFMFGWSRKILAYYDSSIMSTLKADKRWLRLTPHQDDILAAVFWKPHFICTSSFDGSINVWNVETRNLWKTIQSPSSLSTNLDFRLLMNLSRASKRSERRGRHSFSINKIQLMMSGVDLLIYLHRRDADVEAPLVAVEGSMVHFWSLLDIGKPLGSFAVDNKSGSFITAIASDENNKFLCTADNQGLVIVWNIEGYASSRRQTNKRQRKISAMVAIPTTYEAPPLVSSWQAHDDEITSLSCVRHNDVTYIVSSSVDCYVKIWTLSGRNIGKFSSESSWSLSDIDVEESLNHNANQLNEPLQEDPPNEIENILTNDNSSSEREVTEAVQSSIPVLPEIVTINTTHENDVSPLTADIARLKNSKSYKQRSLQKNDDQWGSLGVLYKNEVDRRMMGRANRRNLFNNAEAKLLSSDEIGVSCLCLPFKALLTYDTEEYVLPDNPLKSSKLPVK